MKKRNQLRNPEEIKVRSAKQKAEAQTETLINFSFKYLDGNHKKLRYGRFSPEYFCQVLKRTKDLSVWTKDEFLANTSPSLRAHKIDWEFTSEPNGFNFPLQKDIADVPYQFSISSNEYGRVHGFFLNNTFYIVWLDRDHELYS